MGCFGGPALASIGDVDHRASPDLPGQRLGWAKKSRMRASSAPGTCQGRKRAPAESQAFQFPGTNPVIVSPLAHWHQPSLPKTDAPTRSTQLSSLGRADSPAIISLDGLVTVPDLVPMSARLLAAHHTISCGPGFHRCCDATTPPRLPHTPLSTLAHHTLDSRGTAGSGKQMELMMGHNHSGANCPAPTRAFVGTNVSQPQETQETGAELPIALPGFAASFLLPQVAQQFVSAAAHIRSPLLSTRSVGNETLFRLDNTTPPSPARPRWEQ